MIYFHAHPCNHRSVCVLCMRKKWHQSRWPVGSCGAIPYIAVAIVELNTLSWYILWVTSAGLASMMWCHFLLLSVLMQVYCQQTYPYASFRDQTLANHSYVDLRDVGRSSVQCHTDLATCCSSSEGDHRGHWYFPNGTILPNFTASTGIGENHGAQRVVVRRSYNYYAFPIPPSGIYRCDIAIHDVDESTRDIIYMGIYFTNGGIIIIAINLLKICNHNRCGI